MVAVEGRRRLFVACANTNAVWVVDLAAQRATEQIGVALFPNAPPGTTPNALALSPDGTTLLVANADNNTVAVVDVSEPGASRVRGFIPTGWYPTGVTFNRDGRRIYVLNGKGLSPARQPARPAAGRARRGRPVHRRAAPGRAVRDRRCRTTTALAALTKRVYDVTPYNDKTTARAGRRADRLADSRPRRRAVADQARLLRHPREPHLRSDLRRHRRAATAIRR